MTQADDASLATLHGSLEQLIGDAAGSPVRVVGLKMLAGGASQEAWSLDLTVQSGALAGTHALVLRRDMGGALSSLVLSREQEYAALRAVHAAGIPTPRPFLFIPAGRLAGPPRAAFLMSRLEGETIGRRIVQDPALAEARALLPEQLGQTLARIHAVHYDGATLPFLHATDAGSPASTTAIERLLFDLDAVAEPHPAIELVVRWLLAHDPGPGETVLVHGDFRVGNFMIGPEGLRGVLDWENVHLGDPHEDIAWICVRAWRFGRDALPVGGIAEREPFHAAYTRAGGHAVDTERAFFWEVLGNVRWAIGALGQARRHLSGQERSIELASLGRIAAEMELEALNLIDRHRRGLGDAR